MKVQMEYLPECVVPSPFMGIDEKLLFSLTRPKLVWKL